MIENAIHLMEDSVEGYVCYNMAEKTVIYSNKVAQRLFANVPEGRAEKFYRNMSVRLQTEEVVQFYDLPMQNEHDSNILCDLKVGKLDETSFWCRFTVKFTQKALESALGQVDPQIVPMNAFIQLTHDIIFRVDLHSHRVTHIGDQIDELGLPKTLENFPDVILSSHVIHPDDEEEYYEFAKRMMEGEELSHTARIKGRDGKYEWYQIDVTPIVGFDGTPIEMLGRLRNIQDEKTLENAATHDFLSGTLNKETFQKLVVGRLKQLDETRIDGLIFIDVDDFKYINDNFGHSFGDHVIAEVGSRLRACFRSSDYVARAGGDEFIVFIQDVPSVDVIMMRCNNVLEIMNKPFYAEGKTHNITVSVGAVNIPEHGTSYESVYRKADVALYHSKNVGKSCATLYTSEMEHL